MLDGLDAAVQAHVAKLFNVLITDPTNEDALRRFENGVANCLEVYDKMRAVICRRCDDETAAT